LQLIQPVLELSPPQEAPKLGQSWFPTDSWI